MANTGSGSSNRCQLLAAGTLRSVVLDDRGRLSPNAATIGPGRLRSGKRRPKNPGEPRSRNITAASLSFRKLVCIKGKKFNRFHLDCGLELLDWIAPPAAGDGWAGRLREAFAHPAPTRMRRLLPFVQIEHATTRRRQT
jgi:hypothetical protein